MGIEDPHHFTSTWMNAEGNLSSLDTKKLGWAIDFVKWHNHRLMEGWDGNWLQEQKWKWFFENSGAEHLMNW